MWKYLILTICILVLISSSAFAVSKEDFKVDIKVISKDNMANGSVILELTLTYTGKTDIWVNDINHRDVAFTIPAKWIPKTRGKPIIKGGFDRFLPQLKTRATLQRRMYLQDFFSQTTVGNYEIPFVVKVWVFQVGKAYNVPGKLSVVLKPFDEVAFSEHTKYMINTIKVMKQKAKHFLLRIHLSKELSSLTNHPLDTEFIDLLRNDSLEDSMRYPIKKGLAEILVNFKKPLPVEIKCLPKKDITDIRYEMTNILVARLQSDTYNTRLEAATACEAMGIKNKRLVKPLTALLEDPETKSKNLTDRIQQILKKCTPAK